MFLVSQKEFRVHRHASLLFMDTRADFQVDALLRRLCARPSAQLADGLAQRQRCERASGFYSAQLAVQRQNGRLPGTGRQVFHT